MRTLKPGFFKNDALAALSPLTRLLYAGLWCYADRRGRFEWRPARIKAEIMPYDQVDVSALLEALVEDGFVTRYVASTTKDVPMNDQGRAEYGFVVNFAHHQNPHRNERDSQLPAPPQFSGGGTTKVVHEHNQGPSDSRGVWGLGCGVLGLRGGPTGQAAAPLQDSESNGRDGSSRLVPGGPAEPPDDDGEKQPAQDVDPETCPTCGKRGDLRWVSAADHCEIHPKTIIDGYVQRVCPVHGTVGGPERRSVRCAPCRDGEAPTAHETATQVGGGAS